MELEEAIKKWRDKKFFPITTLVIAPTEKCNLKCVFCSRTVTDNYRNVKELKKDRWLKIIDEAESLGVEFIDIAGGGEPFFILDTTKSMMQRIKEHKMRGSVTTNGTLITESIARNIVEIGWENINFSIDGPYPELNDKLRGKGTFKKATDTIKKLNAYKKELGKNTPDIAINTVLIKRNYKLIQGIIELALNLKIDRVNFIGLTYHDEETKAMKLNNKEVEELSGLIDEALKTADKYKIKTNLKDFKIEKGLINKTNDMKTILTQEKEQKVNSPPCKEPWTSLVIHPDGYIDPCQHNSRKSNIRNRSLIDVWLNDPYLNTIRESIVSNILLPHCNLCCSLFVAKNKLL